MGGRVEQHEKALVFLTLAGLAGLAIDLLYFFLVGNKQSEILFLFGIFSVLVVFICFGLGMVKYAFIDQIRAGKTVHPFMKQHMKVFLSVWFIMPGAFLIDVAGDLAGVVFD